MVGRSEEGCGVSLSVLWVGGDVNVHNHGHNGALLFVLWWGEDGLLCGSFGEEVCVVVAVPKGVEAIAVAVASGVVVDQVYCSTFVVA